MTFFDNLNHRVYRSFLLSILSSFYTEKILDPDFNSLPIHQLIGKPKVCHIRTTSRAIYGKETQASGGNVIELRVCMRHKLIGLLSGRIQRYRVVHLVICGVRHLLVRAIDGGAGSVHQMFHRIMAAGFENVVEANHVALDVSVRVRDGITNTCLCAEVHHNVRVILLKNTVNEGLVCQITFYKGIVLKLLEFCQTFLLDTDIIVIVHVVQSDDLGIRLGSQDTLWQG